MSSSLSLWIGFHFFVAAALAADVLLTRGSRRQSASWAIRWTMVLVVLAACFCSWIGWQRGPERALEFASSYLIEGSLSVDNLFVFLLLFRARGLTRDQQHKALLWGVAGAMLMRAFMILLGVKLLEHFSWVQYLMGAFLVYTALRLFRQKQPHPPAVSRAVVPPRGMQQAGKLLLMTIVAIELTDVAFALDSVPAVLSITRDPMIAYTSNVFAILGLRSLYLALAHFMDKLRGLHYGLSVIVGFIGVKMLAANWVEIPVPVSLAVILMILTLSVTLSIRAQRRRAQQP